MYLLILSSLIWTSTISASLITPRPPHPTPFPDINPRQQAVPTTTFSSTCGYLDGNAREPWTAPPGKNCRQDTVAGLWDFCLNTIQDVSQCSMNGYCVDRGNCSSGCGIPGRKTIQCTSSDLPWCFLAFLSSQQQTYTWLTCSDRTKNEFWLATPNTTFITGLATPSSVLSMVGLGSLTSSTSTTSASSSPATNTNTAASATSNSSSGSSDSSSNNTGAIVGGVLGGLALIFLIIVGLIFLKRSSTPTISKSEPKPDAAYPKEVPAFAYPVANTGGVCEIYDNRGEFRELNDTSALRMGSVSPEGRGQNNFNAAELVG